MGKYGTYLFLELFVDSIQSVLDGYPLQVSRCNLEAQWEVQVDLLDWRCGEELLQCFLVIQCCRRRVQFPGYMSVPVASRRVSSTSGRAVTLSTPL